MNNVLEDLMYQAGLTAQGCWDEMDEYDRSAINKFSELIILKCCKMMIDLEIKYPANLTVREIKNHFGIHTHSHNTFVDHENELMGLLARIHRDGGHYTREHGIRKSLDDADTKIAEFNTFLQPNEFNPDWDRVAALEESLREHMLEIQRLRSIAQPEPEPVVWDMDNSGRTIQDNDWTHDVVLRVEGDFESDSQRIEYVRAIVSKLNAASPQRKPLTHEQVIAAIKNISHNEMSAFNITRAVELVHGIGCEE